MVPFHLRDFTGEFIGTFMLVFFGCGSVAVTVLFSAHNGLLQVAMVWGAGVALSIYATRHLSCAHLNPAVSVAMVVGGRILSGSKDLKTNACCCSEESMPRAIQQNLKELDEEIIERFSRHFEITGDRSVHYGVFDCAPASVKADDQSGNYSGGACC